MAGEEEEARLADPGPLEGWQITSRPLTFSLTALGFVAQADFTLRNYGGTSLTTWRPQSSRRNASGGRSRDTAGVSLDEKRAGGSPWDFQSA